MNNLSLIKQKILSFDTLLPTLNGLRKQKASIVFTNGCFDILHRGHLEYLAAAADLGDILVVGMNSDASVRRQNKGPERPINDADSRAELLAGLVPVDFVIEFDDDTPFHLIELIQPDVLVKGGDYDANETNKEAKSYIVGSDVIKQRGGKVVTIDLVQGFSTSNVIKKIKA